MQTGSQTPKQIHVSVKKSPQSPNSIGLHQMPDSRTMQCTRNQLYIGLRNAPSLMEFGLVSTVDYLQAFVRKEWIELLSNDVYSKIIEQALRALLSLIYCSDCTVKEHLPTAELNESLIHAVINHAISKTTRNSFCCQLQHLISIAGSYNESLNRLRKLVRSGADGTFSKCLNWN